LINLIELVPSINSYPLFSPFKHNPCESSFNKVHVLGACNTPYVILHNLQSLHMHATSTYTILHSLPSSLYAMRYLPPKSSPLRHSMHSYFTLPYHSLMRIHAWTPSHVELIHPFFSLLHASSYFFFGYAPSCAI